MEYTKKHQREYAIVDAIYGPLNQYKCGWICNRKSVDNMKTILSVLFVLIVGAYAFTGGRTTFKTGDKDVLIKQKLLFEVLQHNYQPGVSIYKPEYLTIVQSFDIEKSFNLYTNVDAVKEFWFMYKKGLMPFNELFTLYNVNHKRQAIALFHFFYYANGMSFLGIRNEIHQKVFDFEHLGDFSHKFLYCLRVIKIDPQSVQLKSKPCAKLALRSNKTNSKFHLLQSRLGYILQERSLGPIQCQSWTFRLCIACCRRSSSWLCRFGTSSHLRNLPTLLLQLRCHSTCPIVQTTRLPWC